MPEYPVELRPAARRQLRKLTGDGRRRVRTMIDDLATDPRPPGVRALTGRPDLLRAAPALAAAAYRLRDRNAVQRRLASNLHRWPAWLTAANAPPTPFLEGWALIAPLVLQLHVIEDSLRRLALL